MAFSINIPAARVNGKEFLMHIDIGPLAIKLKVCVERTEHTKIHLMIDGIHHRCVTRFVMLKQAKLNLIEFLVIFPTMQFTNKLLPAFKTHAYFNIFHRHIYAPNKLNQTD